jgi:hypothetical protein
MPAPMTAGQANAVWDVLVQHAGASEDMRDMFVSTQQREVVAEWRFQGSLGFGGKFRRSGWDDRWYVDCYKEDVTPARQAAIDACNQALAELRGKET